MSLLTFFYLFKFNSLLVLHARAFALIRPRTHKVSVAIAKPRASVTIFLPNSVPPNASVSARRIWRIASTSSGSAA